MGFPTIGFVINVKIKIVSWNGISYNWFCYIRDNWKSLIKWDFVHFVVVKYVKIETHASLKKQKSKNFGHFLLYIRENW